MESGDVRARAVVRGRVQMVGFRAFVRRHASGLRGTVRNRPDGTLEAVIQGSREQVDKMLSLLRTGPMHARVDAVDVEYLPAGADLPPMTVTA